MQPLKQSAIRAFYTVRNSWPVWHTVLNGKERLAFARHVPTLTPAQARILQDLQRDGIGFTTLDELFPGEQMLSKLQADMERRGQIEGAQVRKKTFLRPYWNERDTFDLSNPFFELSIRPEVLSIVNSYDHMWRKLNYMHLTETVPVGESSAVQSQRWHRDHEEKRMVKLFIYLNDVDSEAGPFTYVKGSQFGSSKYGGLFKQRLPYGIYPEDGAVERFVAHSDIIAATGKAGTVIFCDTAGLHRGGHAKSKSRLMFTAFYPSKLWKEPTLFSIAPSVKNAPLSAEAKFALNL